MLVELRSRTLMVMVPDNFFFLNFCNSLCVKTCWRVVCVYMCLEGGAEVDGRVHVFFFFFAIWLSLVLMSL